MAEVFHLFDEWCAAWAASEWPDAEEYLARAGKGADDLAVLIEAHLARSDPPPAPVEAAALVEGLVGGEPLLELRRRRGLTRETVIDFLLQRFGIDARKRQKVQRLYHEIETGQRVPADERLVAALSDVFKARVAELFAWTPRPLLAEARYLRASEAAPAAALAPASAPRPERDEVDELFRARSR